MGIEIIVRIAAVGILASVACIILKHSGKEDIATVVSLAAVIICLVMVLGMISDLFNTVRDLFLL
ncbi:MAG: stage III sporulation protein AC [Firmicutes bacterium]|nr:stage III sporulation protein AC [Bacillota bacterium]